MESRYAGAIGQTLEFWFGPLTGDGVPREDRSRLWFGKNAEHDAEISRRFQLQTVQALAGQLEGWAGTGPRGRLALVLTLDQFTRNIFRDTPRAFAGDERALEHAQTALALGEDRDLPLIHRVFMYLPLEHSESLDMQNESVRRFEQLAREAPPGEAEAFAGFLDYAERHREVIREFGRFPHRNPILDRESTPAEQAYLARPGAGF